MKLNVAAHSDSESKYTQMMMMMMMIVNCDDG